MSRNENLLNNTFFIGVVENRNDPLKLGRVQVRCFGYHSEDRNNIPTDDLPFAHVIQNSNNLNISPPKEGEWVIGLFLDGNQCQQPVVLGILPGIPENNAVGSIGFNDPREYDNTLSESPKKIKSKEYKDDGSGVDIVEDEPKTYPQILKESTLSRLLRNDNINETIVQEKKDNRLEGIEKAAYNTTNETWDEPENSYNSKYPYNFVIDSESGHIVEIDDTPDAERIHIFHRTGSFVEFHPSGDQVTKIVGDDYNIVLKDKNMYVSGNISITVQGDSNIYTKGDSVIQTDGNTKVYNKGTFDILSEGDITIESESNVAIKGERIDLN